MRHTDRQTNIVPEKNPARIRPVLQQTFGSRVCWLQASLVLFAVQTRDFLHRFDTQSQQTRHKDPSLCDGSQKTYCGSTVCLEARWTLVDISRQLTEKNHARADTHAQRQQGQLSFCESDTDTRVSQRKAAGSEQPACARPEPKKSARRSTPLDPRCLSWNVM